MDIDKEFEEKCLSKRTITQDPSVTKIAEKAAQNYIEGKITLSEAAYKAGISVWSMEKYLVDNGFKSSYSIEDLRKELNAPLRKIKSIN